MIRLIETRNFRSLRAISQPLEDFHVLVGPNASGKTTFLDVISFLSDLVGHGLDYAIAQRTSNFDDLTFGGKGGEIELAVETSVPIEEWAESTPMTLDTVRYEVSIGRVGIDGENRIIRERVLLLSSQHKEKSIDHQDFPGVFSTDSIVENEMREGSYSTIILRHHNGEITFFPEFHPENDRILLPSFKFGFQKSALGNIFEDPTRFPVATWLKEFLINGVQAFVLDSQKMQRPSPPGQGLRFKTDGSNLPWVIENLKTKRPEAYRDWIAHVQTALPDLTEVLTIVRDEDRHRYLKVRYANGIEVPSWLVSDGTLRLLALTLPAYLSDFEGIYLIEEPENGIHPRAIETVFQSLSSVYNAQMLLATHSPVILSMVEPKDVLCFAKTGEGITDIVRGDEHPNLRGWKRDTNLSILFAAGVLS